MLLRTSFFLMVCCYSVNLYSQADSVHVSLPDIAPKYFKAISNKAEIYAGRLTAKTEKTLQKLSRWENKIKKILERVNPDAAQRLFENNQLTFSTLLQKYKEGETIAAAQMARYDEYRDKLENTLKYVDLRKNELNDKAVQPLADARQKLNNLNEKLDNTTPVEQFIKERKKQLLEQAVGYLSNSRYLQKINKETYYYFETLRNYKELFSSPKKREELINALLLKIPAFNEFLQKNSLLASLFRMPGDPAATASLAGLQTRSQVTGIIQQQLSAGGPSAMEQFRNNLQSAQNQLTQLKDKVMKFNGNGSNDALPDGFKPNTQKTKTFWQRLETGTNIQLQRSRYSFPATGDFGLSVGYKLNNKSIVGIGGSYKLGLGSGWNKIRLSGQGAGLRSFIDWKIKGNFWVTGGYEQNYRPLLQTGTGTQTSLNGAVWQQSGLLGISKKIPVKSKFFTKTRVQLLWDFLSYQQTPRAQPIVFRVGYDF
jgi:hypothetical protein